MEKYTYTVEDNCDWCDLNKLCRPLRDGFGEWQLSKCEDCDKKDSVADSGGTTEFPEDTTTKENVMNTHMLDPQTPHYFDVNRFPVSNGDDGRHCHWCGVKEGEGNHIEFDDPDADYDPTEENMSLINTNQKENVMNKSVKRLAEITGLPTSINVGPGEHFQPMNADGLIKGDIIALPDSTEFDPTNTNQKENTTMSTTHSSITCEVKDCQKPGKFHMLVWALDFNAYALDHLPLPYQGGSWDKVEMDFCGIHKNVLHRGNAVQLKLAVTPVVSYDLNVPEQRELFNVEVLGQNTNPKEEDTMSTNDGPIPGDIASDGHPYHFTQFRDESLDNCKIHTTEHADCCPCNKEEDTMNVNPFTEDMNYTPTPTTELENLTLEELEALAADLNEEGYELKNIEASAYEPEDLDRYLAELSDEIDLIHKLINNKKEKTMSTTGILCGKCHEKHDTPAEVAACYGVQRKSNTSTKLVKETEGYVRTWFETQKEAVQYLKSLPNIKKGMTPAKNGHGFWTYQAKV